MYFTVLTSLCVESLKYPYPVCDGLIKTYKDSILKTIRRTKLSNIDLCNSILKCGTSESETLWDVKLPNTTKPPTNKLKKPKIDSPKLKILHLTDLHVDYKYTVDSIGNCNGIMCCRFDSKTYNSSINPIKANHWGSVNKCDLPLITLENMFENIAKNEDFDIILWTGDIFAHDIWQQSKRIHLNGVQKLTKLFQKYFPNKKIYSAIGNHDAYPPNLFPTESKSEDDLGWLYRTLAIEWMKTGLSNDTIIKREAFYTTKLSPGFRIISLNTNFCYNMNFWLYIDSKDPFKQLEWFVSVLQNSENNGEKVIIIGHIHPHACLPSFGKNYYKIVNRYENTITAQFFGHSHFDYFEIFYDTDSNGNVRQPLRATNVAFITPSVTTFKDGLTPNVYFNPAYRLYTFDGFYNGSSFHPLSHKTKYLDLIEANKKNKTEWIVEYDTVSSYNMTTLFPTDLDNLVNQMMNNLNSSLTEQYLRYYHKSSITDFNYCNTQCRINLVCKLKQARYDNFIPCTQHQHQ